jgi:hypothetical protein
VQLYKRKSTKIKKKDMTILEATEIFYSIKLKWYQKLYLNFLMWINLVLDKFLESAIKIL